MNKQYINPENVARPVGRYSHAVVTDIGEASIIYIAGQAAVDDDGNLVGGDDMAAQAEFAFAQLDGILKPCGATFGDVVKTNIFVTDMSRLMEVGPVRSRYITENYPASTAVEVSRLAMPGLLIEVEATAIVKR